MTNRAQITLNPSSGLPRDEIVNTIHYDVVTSAALARAAVNTGIETFFNTVDVFLSALVLATGHTVKHYDLDDPPPRVPQGSVFTFNFNTAPNTNRMPGEVALVLSSKAAPTSGVAPGSLRNRIYLGPIAQTAVAVTGLVDSTAVSTIATAWQTMWNGINASGDAEAVVYSPTLDLSFPMTQVFVNDEFDTQRRRGRLETTRTTLAIT